ncbi:MAG: hypothetical protein KDD82_30655, partial [Planctomycetes bacterium]|nr:hypothetical protein [Planctomycetota bacterium]
MLLPISEDKSGVTVPFGFDFPFFGTATTQAGVTSEGYLLFGSAVGNVPGTLPSTTAPNGVIAPLWADFDVRRNPAATIHVQTLGTFPRRRFVAQWSNLPLATDPSSLHTFQVVLHEGSGRFEFRYAAALPPGSVGFEDPTGTQGLDLRSLAAGGQSVEVVQGPPNMATLSPRSSTAGSGVELLVPLDLSGPLTGLRGLQGTLLVTAETAGAPPLLLRGFSSAALPTAFDQEP